MPLTEVLGVEVSNIGCYNYGTGKKGRPLLASYMQQ